MSTEATQKSPRGSWTEVIAFSRDPPSGAGTAGCPDRATSPCYLRWLSGMGTTWVCSAQLAKEKRNRDKYAFCTSDALLAGASCWGAGCGCQEPWGFAALLKGDYSMRSACFKAVGKAGMPGALPSMQSWVLDSQANKREAKEDSKNFFSAS